VRFDPTHGFDAEASSALKALGATEAMIARVESAGRDYLEARREPLRQATTERARYRKGAKLAANLREWLAQEYRYNDWPHPVMNVLKAAEQKIALQHLGAAGRARGSKGRDVELQLLHFAIVDAWANVGRRRLTVTSSKTGGQAVVFLQKAMRAIVGDDLTPNVNAAKYVIREARKPRKLKLKGHDPIDIGPDYLREFVLDLDRRELKLIVRRPPV
jgi:hypothetical protein